MRNNNFSSINIHIFLFNSVRKYNTVSNISAPYIRKFNLGCCSSIERPNQAYAVVLYNYLITK